MAGIRLSTVDAIVIKRKNIGEADRLLTLCTKQYGNIRVVAKGVRKIASRRGPHIEIFNRLTATLHDRKTLTEAACVSSYDHIRRDLQRVGAAYYLCELVDGLLPPEEPHEAIFTLLSDALDALSVISRERTDELRARFAAALLTRLGYMQAGKTFNDNDIDAYVETIMERRLKTVRLASGFHI